MVSIKRFGDFLILESDGPESILQRKLDEIESKIRKMFKSENDEILDFDETKDEKEVPEILQSIRLDEIERSKSAKAYKELKVFLSDDEFRYDLIFRIPLEKAVAPKGQEIDLKDLNTCDVEFKRYYDGEKPLGVIEEKDVQIDKIDYDLFDKLISDIESKYPSGEEEFSIETE